MSTHIADFVNTVAISDERSDKYFGLGRDIACVLCTLLERCVEQLVGSGFSGFRRRREPMEDADHIIVVHMTDLPRLTQTQRHIVHQWLPHATLVADLSWERLGTAVLQLHTSHGDRILKAGGPTNHHIDREIYAHQHFTAPWLVQNRSARMLRHDLDAKILLLDYLPGTLIEGTPSAADPVIYRQTGAMLAEFHGQANRFDPDYELREINKS